MARAASLHLVLAVAAGFALAGCVEGDKSTGDSTASATAKPASSVRLVDRDVEAPEVFQVTDSGLWDGRPSLGGVWVASSDAKDPERVIIRNQANGKFVIGALFRRERENPGPKLQNSSDAATALGMLAGQPAELNVTALRRDEAPAAPAATAPILDAAETVETETLAATAAAAIDSADASASAASAAPAAPAPVEKKRPWWKKKSAEAPAEVEAVAVAEVDSPAPVATPVAAPAAKPAPAAPASGKSLIQLGIFSVEANAKRAADMVTKAGAPAEVRREESKGKAYWRVVAGPAATQADRTALMAKVKGLGFADAYFVAR